MKTDEAVAARFVTDSSRWRAVTRRDPQADGVFVYAVRTTGIYCRPSCPARRPHRENVSFHPTCAAAELAGFRACHRCQPSSPTRARDHSQKIAAACRTIESAEARPSLAALARAAGLSPGHFHRLFHETTGLTPGACAAAVRGERARRELARRREVTEAIYHAGFQSSGRFYAQASRLLGMRPARYQSGGAGETIRFAVRRCALGSLLVACSERGVCAMALGDNSRALARDLARQFPRARLIPGDRQFGRLVAQVVAFVEAPRLGLDLPLDLRGSLFQRRVWQALTRIPPGTTLSYSDLARRLRMPRAVRAVASACAANPIAVAIPCHRVVRQDSGLAGYRWGIDRKRSLLQREQRPASTGDAPPQAKSNAKGNQAAPATHSTSASGNRSRIIRSSRSTSSG